MGQRVPISALPRSRKKKASRKAVYVGKNLSVDTNQGTLLIFQRWGSGSGNNRNLFCPSTLAHRSLLFFCPRGTSRVDYLSTTSTTLLLFLFFSFFSSFSSCTSFIPTSFFLVSSVQRSRYFSNNAQWRETVRFFSHPHTIYQKFIIPFVIIYLLEYMHYRYALYAIY